MQARTGLRTSKRINPVSRKRRGLLADYAQARDTVRERAHGQCEMGTPDCVRVGTEAHHLAGRVGGRLTDVLLLRWTCRRCHDYAHRNVAEAYERGWLVSRHGKGQA